ncbi:hypothetical protein TNCV_5105771 [Trichonephila clavipes]|nr:hypothetical protein TNCV_5105771 [Trichonephila clavipes]
MHAYDFRIQKIYQLSPGLNPQPWAFETSTLRLSHQAQPSQYPRSPRFLGILTLALRLTFHSFLLTLTKVHVRSCFVKLCEVFMTIFVVYFYFSLPIWHRCWISTKEVLNENTCPKYDSHSDTDIPLWDEENEELEQK